MEFLKFFRPKQNAQERLASLDELVDSLNQETRAELQRKLAECISLDHELNQAIKSTQVASESVCDKLKSEIALTRRSDSPVSTVLSIISVCKKLKEGVIMTDFEGNIVQLNPPVLKILGLESEDDFITRPFSKLIEGMIPAVGLPDEFVSLHFDAAKFRYLSFVMANHARSGEKIISTDPEVAKVLPKFFGFEGDMTLRCKLSTSPTPIVLNINASILDNYPKSPSEIIYLFIIRRGPPDGVERRNG